MRAVCRVLAVVVLAACRKDEGTRAGSPPDAALTTTAADASSDGTGTAAAPPPTCPPLARAAIAPFATCGTTVVKSPLPEIADPTGSIAPFFERLASLERGTATRPVRIAMYGDSNLTSDFLPGHLRRVLQGRYGDAGHGWVSWSRPWGSYRHEDVVMAGYWPMFKLYAPTTHVAQDRQYGFANMAAESNEIGAAAWAATAKDPKAPVGRAVSSFELHYLKQPRGGSFKIEVDRKERTTIATRADGFDLGIEHVDVEEGPHEIRGVVRGDGPVRFFGVSLDHSLAAADPPRAGVQVDSLGAGALNYQRLGWVASETRRVGLVHRAYDIVVIWLGTNVMFVPPNKEWALDFVKDLKTALPGVPILILSPGDTVREGETKSDPRIVAVVKQLREVATESGVAFWDFREAMGGDGSIIGFTRRGLTGEDHIHFGPEGSRLMGDRLLCAVTASFQAHLDAHPDAGCAVRGDAGP